MEIWTMEQEAEALRARFAGVNRAAFAREHQLKGGQALIYQHINAMRPISLDAAKTYAKGFGVSLEEISPRLAVEVRSAATYSVDAPVPYRVEEPVTAYNARRVSEWPFTAARADFEKLRPEDRRALDKTLTAFIAGTLASYESEEKKRDKAAIQSNELSRTRDTMADLDDAIEAMEQVAQGSGRGQAKRANSKRGKSG